ncbi:MAG TPA: YhcH/YjgK/YiaL family protein [Bacteroidales bacterium]|nr:YhcH/YjgK/YiaL family protein [Bacteroidales bacterium]
MVLDTLSHADFYASLNPRFDVAFRFLLENDLMSLPAGKVMLLGDEVYANIVDFQGKDESVAKMETHDHYLDIQVPVGDSEHIGWTARKDLHEITQEYNAVKDVTFYADKAQTLVGVQPGQFAILFPHDGHQPGIAPGKSYRKVIVKVKVD